MGVRRLNRPERDIRGETRPPEIRAPGGETERTTNGLIALSRLSV
jgi:hypothetical protein